MTAHGAAVPLCEGRVALVTGAGRGIGRAHALELAARGARVVVNDVGVNLRGDDASGTPADGVVAEIAGAGGHAVANHDDISTWEGARRAVATAIDAFGRLDVVVNNAGIVRDRLLVNMTEDDWDAVVRVHLKGTFTVTHFAAQHWRDRTKQGLTNDARIINTSSSSGLRGNPGQANYGAAKAGIAGLTLISAIELHRYGVTVNAISPGARTRMTEGLAVAAPRDGTEDFDLLAPENIAPVVAWLASDRSSAVTGRLFTVHGDRIGLLAGWHEAGHRERGRRWRADEVGRAIEDLVRGAPEER